MAVHGLLGTIERSYPQDAQQGKWHKLKGMPAGAVLDLVQHQLARPERVTGLQHDGCRHGADEALPHSFVGEVVRQLLWLGQPRHGTSSWVKSGSSPRD